MTRPDHPIDEHVRRVDPVDAQQATALWSDSRAKQALFEEITGMPLHTEHDPTAAVEPLRRRPTSPRRLASLLAAMLLFTTLAGTAIARGVFTPDPQDVDALLENDEVRTRHGFVLPGSREGLDAESVVCVWADGQSDVPDGANDVLITNASDGRLDAPITVDDLTSECATGTDSATLDPGTATLCASEEGDVTIPAVLFAGQDCAAAGYQPADVPALLADINHRRQVEIAFRSIAGNQPETCLPADEAARLVEAQITRVDEPFQMEYAGYGVVGRLLPGGGDCVSVNVFWADHTVLLGPVGN